MNRQEKALRNIDAGLPRREAMLRAGYPADSRYLAQEASRLVRQRAKRLAKALPTPPDPLDGLTPAQRATFDTFSPEIRALLLSEPPEDLPATCDLYGLPRQHREACLYSGGTVAEWIAEGRPNLDRFDAQGARVPQVPIPVPEALQALPEPPKALPEPLLPAINRPDGLTSQLLETSIGYQPFAQVGPLVVNGDPHCLPDSIRQTNDEAWDRHEAAERSERMQLVKVFYAQQTAQRSREADQISRLRNADYLKAGI